MGGEEGREQGMNYEESEKAGSTRSTVGECSEAQKCRGKDADMYHYCASRYVQVGCALQ